MQKFVGEDPGMVSTFIKVFANSIGGIVVLDSLVSGELPKLERVVETLLEGYARDVVARFVAGVNDDCKRFGLLDFWCSPLQSGGRPDDTKISLALCRKDTDGTAHELNVFSIFETPRRTTARVYNAERKTWDKADVQEELKRLGQHVIAKLSTLELDHFRPWRSA